MESIIITPNTKEDLNLLKSLARKMGFKIQVLSDDEKEEIGLLKAMLEGKKTKFVSKEVVLKNLKS